MRVFEHVKRAHRDAAEVAAGSVRSTSTLQPPASAAGLIAVLVDGCVSILHCSHLSNVAMSILCCCRLSLQRYRAPSFCCWATAAFGAGDGNANGAQTTKNFRGIWSSIKLNFSPAVRLNLARSIRADPCVPLSPRSERSRITHLGKGSGCLGRGPFYYLRSDGVRECAVPVQNGDGAVAHALARAASLRYRAFSEMPLRISPPTGPLSPGTRRRGFFTASSVRLRTTLAA